MVAWQRPFFSLRDFCLHLTHPQEFVANDWRVPFFLARASDGPREPSTCAPLQVSERAWLANLGKYYEGHESTQRTDVSSESLSI